MPVADELGTAVLRISVDTKSLEKDLNDARRIIEREKPIGFQLDVSSAQQQFRKLEASAKTLEAQFKKLLGTPLNLNAKNLEKLGDDILKAGTSINNYTRAVLNGEKPLGNSVAALQQQGQAFRTLAANVKIGTTEFNNFTQAALKASQKELFAGFDEIQAAQKLFKLGGEGGVDSFRGTEQLLAFGKRIGDTPAAIRLYIQALQQAVNVTSSADSNFGRLTAEIERQAAALERAKSAASRYNQIFNLSGGPKLLPAGRGSGPFVFSGEENAEERRIRERNERRAGKISGIRDYLSTGGRDTSILSGTRAFARPDADAIRAEGARAAAIKRTADATRKAAGAEQSLAAQRRKDFQGRLSSAAIGGAFPLLFGQGPGASLGGLLGGFAGGGPFGFGASLIGTALGASIDALNQRFTELGVALRDPIAGFDVFIQKATLASSAQESLAKALQETGRTAEAAELVRQEATRTIDPIAAEGAAQAQDNFNRALSDTQDVLGNIVSGPASGFLNFLSSTLRLISGTPSRGNTDPYTTAFVGRTNAANSLGRNAGGLAAGILLAAGGVAALVTGVGAPVGLGLLGSGLSITGISGAGAASASGDFRVAESEAVLQLEIQLEAAKERQAAIERQILQARAAGKTGLAEQLTLQAQFTALRAEELAGLSRIQQELARNQDTLFDVEDWANATRQEDELRKAIELRRQALLDSAKAAQTASIKDLANARELVGVYGKQRDIIVEQQRIRSAKTDADDAQRELNRARANGADPKEIEAAEKLVNAAINRRIQTELEGKERIRQINAEIAAQAQLDATNNRLALDAVKERVSAATQLAGVEQGIVRSTLEQVLNVQAAVNAAKRREQELGAQIDAARQTGDEAGASRLVGEQKVAAEQTRLALIEGATALRDAGQALAKDLEQTLNNLQNLRVSNFKYLSPQEQLAAFQRAQAAAKSEAALAGVVFRVEGGTLEQQTREFQAFADFRRQERNYVDQANQLTTAISTANAPLITSNSELSQTINELSQNVVGLSKKDWAVNVNVASNGSSQASGDVLAGALAS